MRADTVVYNGNIHTQFDGQPYVAALALRAGRVLAVGDDDAMRDLLDPDGEAVDLGGALVIPGLVDAHVHLSWYAHFLHGVDLTVARSAQHGAELVAERAAQTPPGKWIRGRAGHRITGQIAPSRRRRSLTRWCRITRCFWMRSPAMPRGSTRRRCAWRISGRRRLTLRRDASGVMVRGTHPVCCLNRRWSW